MNKHKQGTRKGAAAITILVLLGLMFMALAFCVDIGRMQLADLELQCATDVATRAGAEAMSRGVGTPGDIQAFEDNVVAEVVMIAALNSAGGNAVNIDPTDISFGTATPNPSNPDAFEFNESTGGGSPGALEATSNSLNVTPSFDDFPVVFGDFVGTNSVNLGANASAIIRDRDIVLVLDRTTSMCRRDAGIFRQADYPENLKIVEDLLYHAGDPIHDGIEFDKFTEFEEAGINYKLTRTQALKLAVSIFRDEIQGSSGREQLGLATYSVTADTPALAATAGQVSDGSAFDFKSPAFFSGDPTNPADLQNASEAFKRIVGSSVAMGGDGTNPDGVTDGYSTSIAHEKYSSALETAASGYPDFDHSYLSMRYSGRTNISAGIDAGVDILFGAGRRTFAAPVLIVMTDGNQNEGPDAATIAANQMAAHPNLRIFTVSFGSPADVDVALMQTIATTGRGQHYHANDVNELVEAFRDLARSAGVALIE